MQGSGGTISWLALVLSQLLPPAVSYKIAGVASPFSFLAKFSVCVWDAQVEYVTALLLYHLLAGSSVPTVLDIFLPMWCWTFGKFISMK